jgi:uncharacterized protein (DUF58 family)
MGLQKFIHTLRTLHLRRRFFLALGVLITLFAMSFVWAWLFPVSQALLVLLFGVVLAEIILLYSAKETIRVERSTSKLFSLGDENQIVLKVHNWMPFYVAIEVYDELPVQLQKRDFQMVLSLAPKESRQLRFAIRPVSRGIYRFGSTNVLATTRLQLVTRHIKVDNSAEVATYPSVMQMKKYELMAFASTSTFEGIKKMRRIGHSYEFEQIKSYVQGDDIRSVNWKATSRRNQLMVNQYQDERSQQVYSIIDKSRAMHMPFNGLTLLDYAVNTSLVISNIALKKYDKVGLISFSSAIGSSLRADRSASQLKKILQALYNERSFEHEANYDLLYRSVKNVINSRSLIFLYTNFESPFAMERALPVLRKINHQHLLVVMIFANTELIEYSRKPADFVSDIYTQTIADKLVLEKKHMVMKLQMHGIQTILSRPEDLSINTVNKYLELKARGLI